MRLISYDGGFGRLEGSVVVPMGQSLLEYLRSGETTEGPPLPLDEVEIGAPLPCPGKILCLGLNYRDHASEVGMETFSDPVLFAKFSNSVVGPTATVFVPRAAGEVDYEAELGVVIGRTATEVARSRAFDHVAGYVCLNDLSSRALQFRTSQWTLGKAVDGFLPMGPYLVTRDEIPDPHALRITCEVDGQLRQAASTADMIMTIDVLIEAISRSLTLEPGDVIATGTPSGVGMSMSPPGYLEPGSEVVVEIERVGRLATRIAARPAAGEELTVADGDRAVAMVGGDRAGSEDEVGGFRER